MTPLPGTHTWYLKQKRRLGDYSSLSLGCFFCDALGSTSFTASAGVSMRRADALLTLVGTSVEC